MITVLTALGGAAAAKIAQGKERKHAKDKDAQLLAEVQGSKQALSQERTKRLRAERQLAKLQADAELAERQLVELQQEKSLLLQQLQDQQDQQELRKKQEAEANGHSKHSIPQHIRKKMGLMKAQFAGLQKRLKAVSEENEVLRREKAAAEQDATQLKAEKAQLESKASELHQATQQLSRQQQQLMEQMKAMSVEHERILEQAAFTQKLETRLETMKGEVSEVFTALMNKQLTEQEVVEKLQVLGCVVRLVEPAIPDRQTSTKLVVQAAVPEDLPSTTAGQAEPFQMSFVLDAPEKLRRLMSNSLSRASSCSASPKEGAYRSASLFTSNRLPSLETKVLDHNVAALISPRPVDTAAASADHAGMNSTSDRGFSTYIGDKQPSLQHQKSDLRNAWSLKSSLQLPKFLTSSRSLERTKSDMHDSLLGVTPAGQETQDLSASNVTDLTLSPGQN